MNEWADQANCIGQDTEDFFTPNDSKVYPNAHLLKRICNNCNVQKECLDYALHNKVSGWWGNTTEYKRIKLREALGIIAVPVVPDRDYI
jgi:hypothetical protein